MLPFLTEYNRTYTATDIMRSEDDICYCTLDYSTTTDQDFRFSRLVYLEVFRRAALSLTIGDVAITVPSDWSIVIGDKNLGWLEVVTIAEALDRDLPAMVYNPLSSRMPQFARLSLTQRVEDYEWATPRLRAGHLLCVPLRAGDQPDCILVAYDTRKITNDGSLDISALV